MEIIKAPEFDVCACPCCGTVFRPQAGRGEVYCSTKLHTDCPTCGTQCDAKTLTEDSEDEYFTPDQVHKMSPEEVKKNYSAIMKSMEKWK